MPSTTTQGRYSDIPILQTRKPGPRELVGRGKILSPGTLAPKTVLNYYTIGLTFLNKNFKEIGVQVKGTGLAFRAGGDHVAFQMEKEIGWGITGEEKRILRKNRPLWKPTVACSSHTRLRWPGCLGQGL